VKLGKRATGFFDDEIDALIEEIRRERDSVAARPKPDTDSAPHCAKEMPPKLGGGR
jgi:hypothetical protein